MSQERFAANLMQYLRPVRFQPRAFAGGHDHNCQLHYFCSFDTVDAGASAGGGPCGPGPRIPGGMGILMSTD